MFPDHIALFSQALRCHAQCVESVDLPRVFDRLDLLRVFDLQPILLYARTQTPQLVMSDVLCVRVWKKCVRIFTRANIFCIYWTIKVAQLGALFRMEWVRKHYIFDWKRADVCAALKSCNRPYYLDLIELFITKRKTKIKQANKVCDKTLDMTMESKFYYKNLLKYFFWKIVVAYYVQI